MEGRWNGYENLVDRLQSILAAPKGSKPSASSSTQSKPSSFPRASQSQSSQLHSLPSASHPCVVKTETISESSAQPLGTLSNEVIMQEAVPCPGSSSGGLIVTSLPKIPSPTNSFSTDVTKMPNAPPRPRGHRRAQSEIAFRLPDDAAFEHELDLQSPELPTLSDDAGEDLFNMYIDMEKINACTFPSCTLPGSTSPSEISTDPQPVHHSRSISMDEVLEFSNVIGGTGTTAQSHISPPDGRRVRHQHSASMDGSTSYNHDFLTSDPDSIEAKKALAASKLADLALLDPKRAKRILANRQSAARSKERKLHYILELERKVQKLQTEATTLSAQLTMLQRDTNSLTTENHELKFRIQAMEQQSHLRDALNEALKEEVQRLKLTRQLAVSNGQAMNVGGEHFSVRQQYFELPQLHLTAQHFQQLQQAQGQINDQSSSQQAHSDFTSSSTFRTL
ncbi:hypothetical protein O6H91_05G003600 [Diphasiastrum complanatum]|uniref:Uncharacterized protein n=1 Tax=Diphasiastrum complanatum TaxID=34168 RepID=A0ACC2DKD6_DIPCM|nr:hypothetical protein O6H91_05G003600 [Diphasiastrum complanatum]